MRALNNILKVTISNVINYGSSFLIGFILPIVLSVESYGYYREFILYVGYIYILNFGFNDGIYKKYGGKNFNKIDTNSFISEHNFISYFQAIIMIIMAMLGIVTKDIKILYLGMASFAINMNTFHQNFMLAVGEYKIYTLGNISSTVVYIILLTISLIILRISNFHYYVILFIFIKFLILFVYEFYYIKKFGINLKFDWVYKIKIFKVGSIMLTSNLMIGLVANIGSFIVNNNFNIETFAQYTFQNQLLNVVILMTDGVSMVFYNLISRRENLEFINIVKKISLVLGFIGCSIFFIFKILIPIFLPEYAKSLDLLAITFISLPYIVVIRVLISNIYKSKVNEYIYLRDSLVVALISFILIYLFYYFTNSVYAIAIGTTLSYMLWYFIIATFKFKFMMPTFFEVSLAISHLIVFIYLSHSQNLILAIFLYLTYSIIIFVLNINSFKLIFSSNGIR